MKVTWKGEDGGPDAIERVDPQTGKKYKFTAGKAVNVPEVFGSTLVLGNPYFDGDASSSGGDAKVKDPVDPPAPGATGPADTSVPPGGTGASGTTGATGPAAPIPAK